MTWLIFKCSTLARIILNHSNFEISLLKVERIAGWNSIKIQCILLLWGIFVGSGFLELISGFLSLGFDVKALIPQGLTGRPNYFGLLNNLMTLIIWKVWEKSVRWHVSRLPGPLVERLFKSPRAIFFAENLVVELFYRNTEDFVYSFVLLLCTLIKQQSNYMHSLQWRSCGRSIDHLRYSDWLSTKMI